VNGSRRHVQILGALIVITGFFEIAHAQSADNKAAAETMFREGRRLMIAGEYAEACPKFLASQNLDPGVGTLLNLGDCYAKNGQTASAWAQFIEAASEAHRLGDTRRQEAAQARATELEVRLVRLTIVVPPAADVAGLEIKRDGTRVDRALWGAALPVDPGKLVIEATAPGKKKWTVTVPRKDGDPPAIVTLPVLEANQVALVAAAPGGAHAPSRLDASLKTSDDGRDDEPTPWYGHWYTWAGAGSVVAAGVVVALLVTSGSEPAVARHEPTSGVTVEALRVAP